MSGFEFDMSGLDELENEINSLANKAASLDGAQVEFADLFTAEFMESHAGVSSFDVFLDNGNFNVETQEDFEAIPEDDLDKYVLENTDFSSWEEMLDTATGEYLESQLGF